MSEIEYLDFNFFPRCENLNEPCMEYAAWRCITSCCNKVLLICADCKYWLDRLNGIDEEDALEVECVICGEVSFPTDHYKLLEPLT